MDTSPKKAGPIAQAPKKEEIDPKAAAATRKKLEKSVGYMQSAFAGESGGFGGNTALS